MTIKTFFILLTLVLSAILAVVVGALMLNTNRMLAKFDVETAALESISVAQEIKLALLAYARDANWAQLTGDPLSSDMQEQERQRVFTKLAEAVPFITSDAEKAVLQRIEKETASYLREREATSRLNYAPNHPSNAALSRRLDGIFVDLDHFIDINRRQAQSASLAVTQWEQVSNEIAVGAVILVSLLGIGVMLFFRSQIYIPLQNINSTLVAFARGDLEARASQSGPLEIQAIGLAFNEMTDALAESRQRQLQFLAGVVHDLKTPLTVIKGYTGLLLRRHDNERSGDTLRTIDHQVTRLDVMLQDLLDATSIEGGQLKIAPTEIDVFDVLKRSVELFSPVSPNHTIRLHPPGQTIRARADGLRLEQVFGNLISNAIKYSPAGKEIDVHLQSSETGIEVQVADQGRGIPPAEWDRIFLPFARSKLIRDTIPGVGLGLSVSRKIVQAHGGTISVQSIVGHGSTFTVSLPL